MYSIDMSKMRQAASIDLERRKQEAAKLLLDTDWYVVRAYETGQPVPEEVTASRAAARALLG